MQATPSLIALAQKCKDDKWRVKGLDGNSLVVLGDRLKEVKACSIAEVSSAIVVPNTETLKEFVKNSGEELKVYKEGAVIIVLTTPSKLRGEGASFHEALLHLAMRMNKIVD